MKWATLLGSTGESKPGKLVAADDYIHLLSILALASEEFRAEAELCLPGLDDEQWDMLSSAAAAHHVIVRAFEGALAIEGAGRVASLVAFGENSVRPRKTHLTAAWAVNPGDLHRRAGHTRVMGAG